MITIFDAKLPLRTSFELCSAYTNDSSAGLCAIFEGVNSFDDSGIPNCGSWCKVSIKWKARSLSS